MFGSLPGDAPHETDRAPSVGADSGVPEQSSALSPHPSPPPVAAELPGRDRGAKAPPRRLAATGIGLGLAGFVLLLGLLLFRGQRGEATEEVEAAPVVEAEGAAEIELTPAPVAPAALPGGVVLASSPRAEVMAEQPWRLDALEGDAALRIVRGTMKRRSLVAALTAASVPEKEVYRLIKAFEGVAKFDRPGRLDAFVVAMDRAKKVKAFEYEASATTVYQAREGEDGLLRGEKLDLKAETRRVAAAVRVGGDLAASCREAGLTKEILGILGDALEDRVQLSGLHPNGVLRIVAKEESAFGKVIRYSELETVEYRPPGSAEPLRIYRYDGKRERGFFDANGRAPFKGGWRMPIPFARISSHFNPRRRHPVLRKIKPHNGVDFAAPPGTPVYAPYPGTVETVGRVGPNGNLVTIRHAGNIVTGYAHLSRFAAGLKRGQKVKTRQVIGYVGTTGRSTGPHLHFSAKRQGKFIDPLSLRLDGLRVLPAAERPKFQKTRAELDRILDAIPLPSITHDEPELEDEPMGEEDED